MPGVLSDYCSSLLAVVIFDVRSSEYCIYLHHHLDLKPDAYFFFKKKKHTLKKCSISEEFSNTPPFFFNCPNTLLFAKQMPLIAL